MANTGKVQSIDRAMRVLGCFSDRHPELKLTEIAEELDLNKSTLHGIINTLKSAGLIDQNEENQKYRLGLRLVELGALVLSHIEIRDVARPILEQLVEEVNETVHLGQLEGREIVYIDKVESTQSIRIFTHVGTRYDAHCTAIGKAILSHKALEEQRELIPKEVAPHTEYTITDRDAIMQELAQVRKMGYAMDLEENVQGLKCVGAPIYDHEGNVQYSLSVSGPVIRMTDEKTEFVIERVQHAAQEISRLLGYRD